MGMCSTVPDFVQGPTPLSEAAACVGHVTCLEYGKAAGTPSRELLSPGDFSHLRQDLSHYSQ